MIIKNLNLKLYFLIVVIFWISIADAQQIRHIDESIKIEEDGSAYIRLKLDLQIMNDSTQIQIPAVSGNPSVIKGLLDADQSGIEVLQKNTDNYSYLEIVDRLPIGRHIVIIDYVLPEFMDWSAAGPGEFSTYKFGVELDNPFQVQIDTFNLAVSLPQGWNYHKIIASNPVFEDKDPQPPYQLFSNSDGLASLSISRTNMRFKDSIGLTFLFKSSSKSVVIIVVAVILAGLYMIIFRDLINNRNKK